MYNIFTVGTLLLTLLLTIIIWYIQFHIKRRELYKLAEQFNGPTCLPLIGNALNCFVPLTELTERILKGCEYYKSPARLWFGPFLSISIWDPENVKIVLNSPHALEKQQYLYKLLEPITGRGILTSPVEEWRRHRRLLSPCFNRRHLEGFFDIFCNYSIQLLDKLDEKVDSGIFNAHDYLVRYALNNVLDTILDFRDREDLYTSSISGWIHTMFSAAMSKMTTIWYNFDVIFNMSVLGKKMKKAKKDYQTFMDSIIDEWRESSLAKHGENNDHLGSQDPTKLKKLIEHLLSTSDGSGKLTIEELKGEVNTIILAGLETQSAALGFSLILLGMHPEIQETLHKEINKVLSGKKQLHYDDLKKLEYMERVIKETLRIFPPAAGIARYNDKEIQLKDHTIPSHTTIILALISLHRNPDIWPNPTKFDPNRFLPEEEAKRHPYSWMAFSAGPRNCIGLRYAWMSLKIALTHLILKYEVTTEYKSVEDIRLTTRIMYEPTDGYKISITPRRNDT